MKEISVGRTCLFEPIVIFVCNRDFDNVTNKVSIDIDDNSCSFGKLIIFKGNLRYFWELTNFDDKMVGAKFNVYKDPIIKRIPNTNNPYCMQMTPFMDKVFYLNDKGEIY